MQSARAGEHLWNEWDGYDYPSNDSESVVFFTYEWIDLDNLVIREALASALQRSGSVDGLGAAFRALDSAEVTHGWAAHIGGEHLWSWYDAENSVDDPEDVADKTETTWVEISVGR